MKKKATEAIGLIACSSQKLETRAPARELYSSQLFKLSLAYLESRYELVYVLSALHGLTDLARELSPYNMKLSGKKNAERWGRLAAGHIIDRHGRDVELEILAGADYTKPLLAALGSHDGYRFDKVAGKDRWMGHRGEIKQPLAGMMIGRRLAFLSADARARRDAATAAFVQKATAS